jgi:hypothetical protein
MSILKNYKYCPKNPSGSVMEAFLFRPALSKVRRLKYSKRAEPGLCSEMWRSIGN